MINDNNSALINKNNRRIYFKTHCRHFLIDPERVLFCKAEGSYTRLFLDDNTKNYLVSKTLKTIEREIASELFLRCHSSYLINAKKVQFFSSKKKIITIGDQEIPISRRKAIKIYMELLEIGIEDNFISIRK